MRHTSITPVGFDESIKQQKGRKSLVINAKYRGRCAACHQPFGQGAQIVWFQNPSQYFHTDCWSAKFGMQCTAIAQNPVTREASRSRRVRLVGDSDVEEQFQRDQEANYICMDEPDMP
jgi:hypothetical protein